MEFSRTEVQNKDLASDDFEFKKCRFSTILGRIRVLNTLLLDMQEAYDLVMDTVDGQSPLMHRMFSIDAAACSAVAGQGLPA